MKTFFNNSQGQKLCGILSEKSKDIIIVMCHGFYSSKDSTTFVTLEDILNKENVSTFRFDFHGHGESDGLFEDITLSQSVDDALKAIDFVKSKGFKKIGLVGSSFGGFVSILATSKSPEVSLLALKSPVSNYIQKLIAHDGNDLKQWKEQGFIYRIVNDKKLKLNYSFYEDAENCDGYLAAKKITVPTLIVHGDKDSSVPLEQSKTSSILIQDCRLEIIKGADHQYTNKEDFDRLLYLISNFIIEKS